MVSCFLTHSVYLLSYRVRVPIRNSSSLNGISPVLYNSTNVGMVRCLKLCLIIPSIDALLIVSLICSLNDNFSSNRTPKFLTMSFEENFLTTAINKRILDRLIYSSATGNYATLLSI